IRPPAKREARLGLPGSHGPERHGDWLWLRKRQPHRAEHLLPSQLVNDRFHMIAGEASYPKNHHRPKHPSAQH
ncbi:MAG: hypothetical protein OEU92_27720, partial [Alphaproteobacteria bacterium]|nr:hypothetical protein [Alphaproteobacteria bacterium]